MSASVVLLERPAKGVALLRINRPEARNALNLEVRKLIARHFTELAEDEATRCVVLAGNEKSFAAGADIKEMAGAGTIEMMQRGVDKLWRAICGCPKPVIAAVNGFALGGGCELAMTCDIIIAGESAKFGQPEVKIGIIPGGGATQRLTRVAGKYQAMKYILTGELFGALEALTMGLVSEVVPDAEVESRAVAIATQIADLPPLAIWLAKESVLNGMEAPLGSGLAYETKLVQILFSSQDQKEGMAAFIEKRKPKFQGK
ncbi:MAG: enoyl-CoA hydratase-related protein [Betaproteobacteria bacterium]|nr:enoyl-CoA hydratase-related protein [Betaproteobacteria bacterium]